MTSIVNVICKYTDFIIIVNVAIIFPKSYLWETVWWG